MGLGNNWRVDHKPVGGVPVALASEADMLQMMAQDCAARARGELNRAVTVFDCNGQAISLFQTDLDFAESLKSADIVHADGQFVVWMSRLSRGMAVPERTATTDYFHSAAKHAAEKGLSFYLLGGTEEVNSQCADRLLELYPDLKIAGRRDGFFPPEDEAKVIDEVNASGADIVWVGLGKPREQAFCARHHASFSAGWVITCGGCFNFVTGHYARAPQWMQRSGLEWLHRMFTGPKYLIGRYAFTIPHAIWLVLWKDILGQGNPAMKTS
ncbi:MAG: WecB/TagA/CpsF family glycosyltransferase [Pseudomonadota bacterium]